MLSAKTRAAAAAAALVAAAAAVTWRTARRPAATASGSCKGCNLLLITIDTLRVDRVGAFGSGRHLTPNLDRLAARGIRFTNAHAHAPLTLPAHTSILTGLVPANHGVHDNGSAPLDPAHRTLAEALHAAGYRTGAFVGAFVLDARFGLNRGFDVYDDKVGSAAGPVTFAFAERPADRVVKAAADWILGPPAAPGPEQAAPAPEHAAPGRRSPWFAWVHLFDPHAPYRAPEQRVSNPYDNEVAFVDEQIGRLFERLEETGQLARTVVVVLADHGESLGEHGEATHGLFAYEATLHIPLIVAGLSTPPAVSAAPIAQVDVMPTALDVLGVPRPSPLDGRSMLSTPPRDDRPVYFEALDAYLTRNWAPLTGVIEDGWKYINLPEPELYDLRADPGEAHNVAGRRPDRAKALDRQLASWNAPSTALAGADPARVDSDAAARLRSLGYSSGVAPRPAGQRYTVQDDPKRLVDLDREYERALTLTGDGRFGEAEAILRGAIRARPDFVLAYTNLASVLMQAGQPRAAIDLLETARQRGIASPTVEERLAAAYLAAGDPRRTVQILQPMADASEASLDAQNALAVALAETGDRARARRLFEQVLRQSPSSATTWGNLGLLEMADHRPADSARAFERAVAADPRLGSAWQALGALRVESDPAGALDAWRRAAALMPGNYDLLFNLAVLLRQQGQTADARAAAERFVREAPPGRYARDIAQLRAWLDR